LAPVAQTVVIPLLRLPRRGPPPLPPPPPPPPRTFPPPFFSVSAFSAEDLLLGRIRLLPSLPYPHPDLLVAVKCGEG